MTAKTGQVFSRSLPLKHCKKIFCYQKSKMKTKSLKYVGNCVDYRTRSVHQYDEEFTFEVC